MVEDFKKLAKGLYEEGYMCGISGKNEDKWFDAWACAMEKIAKGAKYTDDLVIGCFNEEHRV